MAGKHITGLVGGFFTSRVVHMGQFSCKNLTTSGFQKLPYRPGTYDEGPKADMFSEY